MKENVLLKIADPCHENWATMTPDAKGRHCAACNKVVIDFTNMNDQQILDHLSKAAGKTCGRFYGDQLNRTLTPTAARKMGRWKYFWQIALPLFFLSNRSTAQIKFPVDTIAYQAPDFNCSRNAGISVRIGGVVAVPKEDYTKNFLVTGKVVDQQNNPLPHATVMIKETNIGTTTDSNGEFVLAVRNKKAPILVFSYVGFNQQEKKIVNASMNKSVVDLNSIVLNMSVQGEIVIVRKTSKKKSSFFNFSKKNEPVCSKPEEQAVLQVYPNPFKTNGTISLKNIEPGDYNISLFNMDGVVIHQQRSVIKSNSMQETITLSNQPQPGVYAVKVSGNGKLYTTTLLIQ